MAAVTCPPRMAGVELSGWPSMVAAIWMMSSRLRGEPRRQLAPISPATMQAELLPRPRAMGMAFSWRIRRPGRGLPQISKRYLAVL